MVDLRGLVNKEQQVDYVMSESCHHTSDMGERAAVMCTV